MPAETPVGLPEPSGAPPDVQADVALYRLGRFVRLAQLAVTADGISPLAREGLSIALSVVEQHREQAETALRAMGEAHSDAPAAERCAHLGGLVNIGEPAYWVGNLKLCRRCLDEARAVHDTATGEADRQKAPAVDDCEHLGVGLRSDESPQRFYEFPTHLGFIRRCSLCAQKLEDDLFSWNRTYDAIVDRQLMPGRLIRADEGRCDPGAGPQNY